MRPLGGKDLFLDDLVVESSEPEVSGAAVVPAEAVGVEDGGIQVPDPTDLVGKVGEAVDKLRELKEELEGVQEGVKDLGGGAAGKEEEVATVTLDGEVCRHEDGKLVERTCYKDQKLHGPSELYENGALVLSMNYKEGVLTGPLMQYGPNGYPLFRSCFVDGQLHGPSFVYDGAGALLEIKNYLNGRLHGEVITYHPSGAPYTHGQYVGGLKHGEFTQYDEQGVLVESLYYEHDVLVRRQGA